MPIEIYFKWIDLFSWSKNFVRWVFTFTFPLNDTHTHTQNNLMLLYINIWGDSMFEYSVFGFTIIERSYIRVHIIKKMKKYNGVFIPCVYFFIH